MNPKQFIRSRSSCLNSSLFAAVRAMLSILASEANWILFKGPIPVYCTNLICYQHR